MKTKLQGSAKNTLHSFHGGMRLDGHKTESLTREIQVASLPDQLFLPLKQHIGDSNKPLVAIGDSVQKGQVIAANPSLFCAPVHAPVLPTRAQRRTRAPFRPTARGSFCR